MISSWKSAKSGCDTVIESLSVANAKWILKTNSDDCASPEWTTPTKHVRMDPPKDTLVVVVDVRGGQGAIRIMNIHENKYVDDVGPTKENGNMVIIPWNPDWWYYAIGQVHVAHIRSKS